MRKIVVISCLILLAGNVFAAADIMVDYEGGNEQVNWHTINVYSGTYSFEVDGAPSCKAKWYKSNGFVKKTSHFADDPDYTFTFSAGTTTKIEASLLSYYKENWLESHIWTVTCIVAPDLDVDQNSLDFDYNDSSKYFYVENDGGGTLDYTITDNVSWLTYNRTSGSTSSKTKIYVYLDRSKMGWANNQTATITVKNNDDSGDKETITVTADNPDPDPKATRVTPSRSSVTLSHGARQRFTVRGEDDGGDLDKVIWTLSGAASDSDTDSIYFSGSNDTTDFKDAGDYTFNTSGDYTLRARVYDDSGDYDDATWSIHVNDPPKPDLITTDIWIDPSTIYVGDKVDIYAKVKNTGNADANAPGTEYIWTQFKANRSIADHSYGQFDNVVMKIEPGETRIYKISDYTVPNSSSLSIVAIADTHTTSSKNNRIDERSEPNNDDYSESFTVKKKGSAKVLIYPAGASNAEWKLTKNGYDSGWQDGGVMIHNLIPGDYTVEFKSYDDWKKPDNVTLTVPTNGGTGTQSGTYRRITNAWWFNAISVQEGTVVTMKAEVEGFNVGDTFDFEVREADIHPRSHSAPDGDKTGKVYEKGGRYYVEASWTAVWWYDDPGDPEYYFNVSRGSVTKRSPWPLTGYTGLLKVTQRPKSGQITGVLNNPSDFGGEPDEIIVKVKNKGRDRKNLIVVPVPDTIPQGWKVSPNDQQTKVPYGTENKSYFKFKITPPSSSDSTGSIIWKLYYDETYPTANTLLGDYTMSVSSKPRGSISAYLYNQHNEEAADAKTKFSFWARDQHPVGENPKLFSDIPITADGYWISGYQKGKFSEWEYWGSKKIVVQKNITLPLNIVRNMPWSTDITIHKASDHSVVGATINPGTEVYAAIHVVNNDSVDHRCKVEFLLDGSNGGMDWSNIIGDVNLTKNGGTQTFRTAHFTPGEGDYSGGFKVRTLNNDGNAWDVTDTRVNYPQFKAVVNRPTLGSITLTDLDGNSVSKLEPGKRYIASTSYHDKDGRGDLKECKVILRNSNDSRRDIELIYDVANDRKKVGDGSGDTCFETRVGKPVLDDYVHLTHVEVSDAVNGYDVRYIFWLSAKWAENKSGGVRVHAKAKDQAGNSSPESELQKAFNFEPLSLPADKWTVIVHGKSNSDDNNFLVPGLGQGPWSWDVNPTTWFKGMSDPTTHSSRNPYDAWAWEIGYKFNHISKTPVKIHRLGDRNAFTLETWSDTISRNADYGPYDYDSKSHNILIFDWDDPSDYLDLDDWSEDNWYAYASGDALYALISKLGIQDNINTVIGYSRGGVVSSEFARRMRIEGKTGFQVIYLDAEGWGEFDNELSAQQFAEGAVDFSNIKLSVDVASVIGGKYVGTAADIVKYAVDWAFPPELSNDWEADNASELSLLKDVLGLPYADYRFFGFEGLRVDQYRQAYSNPEKMFCGAESLSGGGNDQLVEGWPAYTAATNYSSVPVDISIGDELSHTFFPHYLTDWCYLAQDATKGNSVCIETPQLWRWQDQNDAWQTRAILSYPTLQASTPDNTTGDVFNSGARDGSAAGWSYHGGITPFESWGINGIEKVDDGYEFQFELPNGLEELVHNWQVTPRAPKRLRFDLEYRDAFFEEYDEFHVYWNNYTHLKTVRSSDVYEVQKSIQCNFYYPDTVGRLYFRSFFNGAEFLLDNVEFDSDEPPRISTFEVFPSSISRGEDLTFRASGVQVGDASIDRVEFYLDDGDGVFDYATDGDSVPIATVDSGSENVWEVTKSSENVPEGTLWFFAVAWDANHLDSYPVISKAQVTVTQPANRLPTIGSLNCDGSVVRGNVLTLTTTGISDSEDGSVAKVVFYYDENRNGILDIGAGDRKLATDLSGNSTSTYDVDTAALPAGTAMFFAVAYDSKNARSASVSCRSSVIQKWQLSYSVSGSGTILEKPDAGSYKDGTVVNPSASANSGGEFNHWEANGLTVSMPIWLHENTTITAVFVPSGGGAVAPVINRIEKQSVALGQAFSFTPTLQQGDAPITWSLENKPTGMTIDQLGIISWSSPAPSGSSHVVVVKASNSARSDIRSDMKSFTLYVTAPRYMLTVNKGNGGGEYSEGRTINISPTPQPDGIFSHWTGDTQNLIGSVLTMPANPITVTANFKPAPDLVATNGTYEARRYLHDETLPISITSTNIGTANATGEFLVQAVLSPDKVWDNGNDYPLGTNLVNKLVLGQELVETINGVVSTSIPEGSYYLGVKIDATNNVVEIVEDNNVWWSDALDVDISAHPAWSFDPSTNIHASGEADSGAFTVNQIAGLDAAWTASVHSASADWITLDSNYSDGMGSGDEVRYSIPLNDTRLNRTGSILVEGLPFVVEQSAHLPLVPICIHPNDGQSNVERDLTLWWKDGGYSSGYEIWFGKDSGTLKFVAEITSSAMTNSYQTGLREEAQPFQWQVIAFNEGGSTNGAVWRFSTENKLRPGEVFEQNGMDWNNTSTVPWFAQTVEKYSGSAAMQSGAIGDGQVSVLEATVVGPGTLDFWWKVDSEANDFLNLYLGTNLYDGIAGSGNWMQESVPVPTGVQKLSWKYEKDGSGSTGTDCGWLDDVQWQGENSTTFPLSGFADKWVATYLWDKTANEWIVLSNSEKGPTEVVVKNIKPDQWYWLCVMEYDGTNWNLAHGSWISHLDEM